MLGSYILIRTVIVASMSFTHTRTSLLSTTQIRCENCLDNFAVLLGVLEFMKCHNWSLFLQIIHVNLTHDDPKPLEAGRSLDMTYSVKWIATNVTFRHRFDVYLDYPFFEHQVINIFCPYYFSLKWCLLLLLVTCYVLNLVDASLIKLRFSGLCRFIGSLFLILL